MTFGYFKDLTTGLLRGDNALPKEDNLVIPLLEKAFLKITSRTDVLRVMTLNKDVGVLRTTGSDYIVRFPTLPSNNDDTLDIDHELAFAAASYVASYLSNNNKKYHTQEAEEVIELYMTKVDKILKDIGYDRETQTCNVPREY